MTYQAVEVTVPGTFSIVQRPMIEPGPRQVRVKVQACGVCHSDAATFEGSFPGITYPRVPGHEIIGFVDAVGASVSRWKIGQRVGLGFFGGEDGECTECRRGDFINCQNPIVPGITVDGGYAEIVIAEARALAAIPDELQAAEAAPLLCAGVTTYNALRNAGLRAGDLVGVQGIGGLGHLGLQFSDRMGFRTVAIARGADKEPLARQLGAHAYIDTAIEDPVKALQQMGGARAILATAPNGRAMGELLPGLGPRGQLIVLGVASDPLQVSTVPIVFGQRTITGSLTGSAIDEEEALSFSVLQNVRPMIETVPLHEAPAAYARMMGGNARFRMVLVMQASK